MYTKEELERDLTFQVADKITLDRARTKGLLDALAADSASIQEVLASTRANYAGIQKDANARLVVRIEKEKAVREARKLRTAAEQMPELEPLALKEIKVILDTALTTCRSVVASIKTESFKQLKSVEPLRITHRDKMVARVNTLIKGWDDLEERIHPLIANFNNEAFEHLKIMKTKCMEKIEHFRDQETNKFDIAYAKERKKLMKSFRDHFRNYDLSEAFIFERYNIEVIKTVQDARAHWGPSKPEFIMSAVDTVRDVALDTIKYGKESVFQSVKNNSINGVNDNDDYVLQRLEIADVFANAMLAYSSVMDTLPLRYIHEHMAIITDIEERTMISTGDMIRPQVEAVMDFIDFWDRNRIRFHERIYDSLIIATHNKAGEARIELSDFVEKYSQPAASNAGDTAVAIIDATISANSSSALSIPSSVAQIENRLQKRKVFFWKLILRKKIILYFRK